MSHARACACAIALAACGGTPAARVELPATKPAIVIVAEKYDPSAKLETKSEDVTYKVEGHEVPGTIVYPTKPGKWPGLVLMAGSGPTDRDWNSPMIKGKNGSAKLLAEALASHGLVVVRFDKAAVGQNKLALESITLDTYVDEIRGGLGLLRGRADIDENHLFIAGHSEGGIHAIRTAIAEGGRIAGVLLLSSAGRTMREIITGQIAAQYANAVKAGHVTAEVAAAQVGALKQAFDAFIEGRPVDPAEVSPDPNLQAFLAAIVNPKTAKLGRDLLSYDPGDGATKLKVPVFIFNGLKDTQVDPQLDAARLEQRAKAAGAEVTLFLAPDANHVLKHETRSMAALRADPTVATTYNDPGTKLDDTALSAIGNWLSQKTR